MSITSNDLDMIVLGLLGIALALALFMLFNLLPKLAREQQARAISGVRFVIWIREPVQACHRIQNCILPSPQVYVHRDYPVNKYTEHVELARLFSSEQAAHRWAARHLRYNPEHPWRVSAYLPTPITPVPERTRA